MYERRWDGGSLEFEREGRREKKGEEGWEEVITILVLLES